MARGSPPTARSGRCFATSLSRAPTFDLARGPCSAIAAASCRWRSSGLEEMLCGARRLASRPKARGEREAATAHSAATAPRARSICVEERMPIPPSSVRTTALPTRQNSDRLSSSATSLCSLMKSSGAPSTTSSTLAVDRRDGGVVSTRLIVSKPRTPLFPTTGNARNGYRWRNKRTASSIVGPAGMVNRGKRHQFARLTPRQLPSVTGEPLAPCCHESDAT